MKRMENRHLSAAWLQWSAVVVSAAKQRVAQELATTEEHYREMMARQLLARWINKSLSQALLGWFDCVQAVLSRRQKVRACLVRIQQRGMASAYETWKAAAKKAASDRELMRRTATRMFKLRMSQGFHRWTDALKTTKRLRALLGQLSGKTAARMTFKMFGKWKHFVHMQKTGLLEQKTGLLEQAQSEILTEGKAWAAKLQTLEQQTQHEREGYHRELQQAQAELDTRAEQVTLLEQSKMMEVGTLEEEVARGGKREQELIAENQDMEQKLSVLEGLEGQISALFGELQTVSTVIEASSPPPPAPPPPTPAPAPAPAPLPTPEAEVLNEVAASALAALLAEDVIAFDLTHGGMLRLGSNGRHHDQHRSHLESRMLGFIRTHWFLFVTAEIDEPAGRWEDAPMVVLGRALLLAAGMPLDVAHNFSQLSRLYSVLQLRVRPTLLRNFLLVQSIGC